MFKASELVAYAKSMIGMPYWYGTCGYNCTESLYNSKKKQYPMHYTASRTSRYKSDIKSKYVCVDCIGLVKSFFWTNGGASVKEAIGTGKSVSNKYASNGFPDKSADGTLAWCKSKGAKYGKISTLPEVPGVLLFSSGHVGVYIGNGYAVEARGFNYGVVRTKVASRSWTSWAYIPSSVIEYDNASGSENSSGSSPNAETYDLGSRIIKDGIVGDDVRKLQEALVKLGYKIDVDGECGPETTKAIKQFQKDNAIVVDGEFGKKSYAKLLELSAASGVGTGTTQFSVKVIGGKVNIRSVPSVEIGKIVRVVKSGDVLTATTVDSATGWYKLSDGNYISNKYAKIVK